MNMLSHVKYAVTEDTLYIFVSTLLIQTDLRNYKVKNTRYIELFLF